MTKPALQTKTIPPQPVLLKNHIYTMAAAFIGVVLGVLGSMGFVENYLNSQFAAQTASLNERALTVAPNADASADACYGVSTAQAAPSGANTSAFYLGQ